MSPIIIVDNPGITMSAGYSHCLPRSRQEGLGLHTIVPCRSTPVPSYTLQLIIMFTTVAEEERERREEEGPDISGKGEKGKRESGGRRKKVLIMFTTVAGRGEKERGAGHLGKEKGKSGKVAGEGKKF